MAELGLPTRPVPASPCVMSRLPCAAPQPPATPRPVPVFTGRASDPEKSWVTLGLHSDGDSPSQGHQAAERGKTFYCETRDSAWLWTPGLWPLLEHQGLIFPGNWFLDKYHGQLPPFCPRQGRPSTSLQPGPQGPS